MILYLFSRFSFQEVDKHPTSFFMEEVEEKLPGDHLWVLECVLKYPGGPRAEAHYIQVTAPVTSVPEGAWSSSYHGD